MPRFVLLRHECPPGFGKPSHWDLMLEDGSALVSWSVETLPEPGGEPMPVTKLADHRKAFLDYEGPVSGGRGDVRRADAGNFAPVERTPTRWILDAHGQVISGRVTLECLSDERWMLALGEFPRASLD